VITNSLERGDLSPLFAGWLDAAFKKAALLVSRYRNPADYHLSASAVAYSPAPPYNPNPARGALV
jgi:hypothetical protein